MKNKKVYGVTRKRGGYTLIEILIVIAIIGFIAAVAMYTLNSARMRARDTKRMGDLEIIGKAIELYYDEYNHYPVAGNIGAGIGAASSYNSSWDTLQAELIEFIDLPVDPVNTAVNHAWNTGDNFTYSYLKYDADPQVYDLVAQLEDKNNELRCETRCWEFHLAGTPWCDACGGSWDNDIYANH